jgi:putative ABC transport system permease protein
MLRLGPLILRNVLRNRRRSLLTLASTAVSLALLALLLAIYQGFYLDGPATPSEAMRLVTSHRVSLTQLLPAAYQQKIKDVPGVQHVCVIKIGRSRPTSSRPSSAAAPPA